MKNEIIIFRKETDIVRFNIMKKINNLLNAVVCVLFTCIVLFLSVSSLYGTSCINERENVFFISDCVWLQLISIIVVVGVAYLNYNAKKKFTLLSNRSIWYIVLGVYLLCSLFFVITYNAPTRADQKSLLMIVEHMRNHDYSDYVKQTFGYMTMHPHQRGIVYLYYCFSSVFGSSVLGYRIINVISGFAIIILLNRIGKKIFNKLKDNNIIGYVAMLFLPLLFYGTFIYGTLLGTALSLAAIYSTCIYAENRHIREIVLISVFLALAILVKKNNLIFLLGVMCYVFLDTIKKFEKKNILIIVLSIAMSVGILSFVQVRVEKITGIASTEGVPSIAYVAMGMQYGGMAPGWCNDYHTKIYKQNNANTDITEELAKANIGDRINYFLSQPAACIRFYFYKTISQWNDPTFESLWINRIEFSEVNEEQSDFVKWLFVDPENEIYIQVTNIFQSVILFGALCWGILSLRRVKTNQMLLPIIFIGGFLFHLLWEAKSQYTFAYFILLLPIAIVGYSSMIECIAEMSNQWKNDKKMKINKGCLIIGIYVLSIMLVGAFGGGMITRLYGSSNNDYAEFYEKLENY